MADLESRESLSLQDQQLLKGLEHAEKQGLLDVYLVKIRPMTVSPYGTASIDAWRTLTGKDPCLEGTMDLRHLDIILQATPAHYAQSAGTFAATFT